MNKIWNNYILLNCAEEYNFIHSTATIVEWRRNYGNKRTLFPFTNYSTSILDSVVTFRTDALYLFRRSLDRMLSVLCRSLGSMLSVLNRSLGRMPSVL